MKKEHKRDTVTWTFPIENTVNKKEVEVKAKRTNINSKAVFKIFPPIAGAIVVGTVFGVFVLSYAENQLYTQSSTQVNGTQVESEIIVPVVQAGVFSTLEAAKEMESKLPKGTTSEVVMQDGQYYVLLSVEPTIEQAKSSEEDATRQGIDSYARDFKVTSSVANNLTGEQQVELSKIINNFYKMLSVKGSNDTEEINGVELETINDIKENPAFSKIMESYQELEKTFKDYQKSSSTDETKSLTKKMLEFMAVFGGE